MHRIDSDGYVEISGKRYFQNQADGPPPIVGTIDHASWNNAIQEEFCLFLEAIGVTLAADSAADSSGGWHQLRDKLVLSGGLNAANLTGSIVIGDFTGSGEWQQSSSLLLYWKRLIETPLKLQRSDISSDYIQCRIIDDSITTSSAKIHSAGYLEITKNGANTTVTGEGVSFPNGPGTSVIQGAHLRKTSIVITGASWSAVGSDGIYTNTVDQDLGLPSLSTDQVFSAFINYTAFGVTYCIPAAIAFNTTSGDLQDITVVSWDGNTPPATFNLIIEWDATGLTV